MTHASPAGTRPAPPSLAPATETGAIPVFQLKRLWSRAALAWRGGPQGATQPAEHNRDRLCLSLLGVGLEETLAHLLTTQPDFTEFEQWILARGGGSLDAESVARFNRAIAGGPSEAAAPAPPPEPGEASLAPDELRFFDAHGYVVLRGALDATHARACEEFVWNAAGADPADPESWYRPHPLRQNIMVQCFQGPLLEANRRNERIRGAFRQLYGHDDIWPTTDRVGFNPPALPGARYGPAHLHWDTDPTTPVPFELQGIIYLNDVAENQGAFSCVPGFHRRLPEWLASLPAGADPRTQDLDALGRVFVPGNAGDMVIWHQALPHGASYNTAAWPRLVHYLTYLPLV